MDLNIPYSDPSRPLPSLRMPGVRLDAIVGEPDTLRLRTNSTYYLPDAGYQLTKAEVVGIIDWLVGWLAGEIA